LNEEIHTEIKTEREELAMDKIRKKLSPKRVKLHLCLPHSKLLEDIPNYLAVANYTQNEKPFDFLKHNIFGFRK
jgi:hypothetical protein